MANWEKLSINKKVKVVFYTFFCFFCSISPSGNARLLSDTFFRYFFVGFGWLQIFGFVHGSHRMVSFVTVLNVANLALNAQSEKLPESYDVLRFPFDNVLGTNSGLDGAPLVASGESQPALEYPVDPVLPETGDASPLKLRKIQSSSPSEFAGSASLCWLGWRPSAVMSGKGSSSTGSPLVGRHRRAGKLIWANSMVSVSLEELWLPLTLAEVAVDDVDDVDDVDEPLHEGVVCALPGPVFILVIC